MTALWFGVGVGALVGFVLGAPLVVALVVGILAVPGFLFR